MAEKKLRDKKEEKKPLEKVVEGNATVHKKNRMEKLFEDFIVRDLKDVGYYIWKDVMVPGLKDALADTINNTVGMMFWGDAGAYARDSRSSKNGRKDYGSFSRSRGSSKRERDRDDDERESRRNRRENKEYNNIVLDSARDCKAVLDELDDRIKDYDCATIADLYDLTGISTEFTDHSYGWYDTDGFDYQRVRDGWLLKVPKPVHID